MGTPDRCEARRRPPFSALFVCRSTQTGARPRGLTRDNPSEARAVRGVHAFEPVGKFLVVFVARLSELDPESQGAAAASRLGERSVPVAFPEKDEYRARARRRGAFLRGHDDLPFATIPPSTGRER